MYLGQGGKLALPEAGSELIKFYSQIPLLSFNHLFSLNNFLGLKYFLVQSIGFVTLLIRLIFYLDFLMKNPYSWFLIFLESRVSLVFILSSNGFREFQRGVSVTCLSILKMSVKRTFQIIFLWARKTQILR